MRCPTCGSPVMVRKNSWECGYCCDCGNLPRPRIVLTVDVEEEPQLTVEGLAENADPDTALLLRKFSEPLGAWDIEELSAMARRRSSRGLTVKTKTRASPCGAHCYTRRGAG